MNFVSTDDFDVIPFALPNISASKSAFDKYVTQLQNNELRKIFGTYFYDAFQTALDALPPLYVTKTAYAINDQVVYGNSIFKALQAVLITNVIPPVAGAIWELVEEDNRWLLLKNGDTYTYYNRPYVWKGMKESCKGLVYAYWVRDKYADTLTTIGNAKPKSENANMSEMAQRQVRGFNCFVNLFVGNCDMSYNGHYSFYWPYLCAYREDSLIGYLWDKQDNFSDLFDTSLNLPWGDLQIYLSQMFRAPKRWNTFGL